MHLEFSSMWVRIPVEATSFVAEKGGLTYENDLTSTPNNVYVQFKKYASMRIRTRALGHYVMFLPNYTTVPFCLNNYAVSIVLAEHPKTTFFRLFLENAKFNSRKNLDRKLNNFATNNFSSSFTWYIQIFRPMASFRELSCTSRPCLLYIVDLLRRQ